MSNIHMDDQWQRWKPDSLREPESQIENFPEAAITSMGPTSVLARVASADDTSETLLEIQDDEERRRQGFEIGHAEGYRAGKALAFEQQEQTQAEYLAELYMQQSARFDDFFNALQQALAELDSIVVQRLVQFALQAVKSLIGDGTLVPFLQDRLSERLSVLLQEEFITGQMITLWVSVEDEPFIKPLLHEILDQSAWCLKTDGDMLPGGCRLIYDQGERDERVESRWQSLCQLTKAESVI